MAKEIQVELSDETAAAVQRAAEAEHVDPATYIGTMIEANVHRGLFLSGAQACIEEHAEGFARRFGPAPAASQAA
ncbi:hypothetical protein ACFXKF_32670 [Streptomyces scopuliridis]|uniref:hypothetical protein n=1 Tax=Streptomyces scopuliridis TaxID=452529 RepID=UPI00367DD933